MSESMHSRRLLWRVAAGASAAAGVAVVSQANPASAAPAASDSGVLALLRNARSSSRKTLVRMIDSRVNAVTTRVNVLHARTNKAARVVRHGNKSTTARPAWAGSVIWVGSVVPKNRRSGDVFMWEA